MGYGSRNMNLDFYAVHLQSGMWQVSCPKHDPFLFCGTSPSMEGAIAAFFISNREALGIQFTIRDQNGKIQSSTVHGRYRCKEELGENEKIVLDWDSDR